MEAVTAVSIPDAFIPIVTPAYVSAIVGPAIFTPFPTSAPVYVDDSGGGDSAAAAATAVASA